MGPGGSEVNVSAMTAAGQDIRLEYDVLASRFTGVATQDATTCAECEAFDTKMNNETVAYIKVSPLSKSLAIEIREFITRIPNRALTSALVKPN